MHICYIDESGDSQQVNSAKHEIQPMLVIAGLFVDAANISKLTDDFIRLKRKFYPNLFNNLKHLDILIAEIKGSDIRSQIRKNPPKSKIVEHNIKFLDEILKLCSSYDIKLVSRILVKEYKIPLDDRKVYTLTSQDIAKKFQHHLAERNSRGMIIADFRDPHKNGYVAHSIFTQKHKAKGGDAYPLIEETAVFGISNNHACLQIADLICSTLLYPIAGRTVCKDTFDNVHTHQGYDLIVKRFSKRVKALQFNCTIDGYFINGVTVKNPHSNGVRGIFPEKAVAAAKGVNPPNAMALAFQAAQTPNAPAATEAPAI